MSNYLLKAENIYKSFDGVQALKDVSLYINKGEIVCLAGENGSGKSTLIKVISGDINKDSGSIEFDGEILEKANPSKTLKKGIQVIYQDLSVFPNLTVMENLALNTEINMRRKIIKWSRMKETAKTALQRVGIKLDLYESVGNLSVANKQLIAISRAILNDAKLIIMDEPTTALTRKEIKTLFCIIKELKNNDIATLFISHKLDEVFEISEKYTILRNGIVVSNGLTSELDRNKFTFFMTGKEIKKVQFKSHIISTNPVLEVRNLSLKSKYANVSFSLKKGEILGITGLLGSGRTELALSLFGIKPSSNGDILMNGEKIYINNVQDALKYKIGYVPEDRLTEGLFLKQSIGRNVIVARLDALSNRIGKIDNKKARNEIKDWVKKLSILTDDPGKKVSTLSGGNQQRVVLAKSLANKLEVLILNGPTVGVDVGSKEEIHNLIRELAKEGLAIIVISDDLPELVANCNKVIIMKDGIIVSELDSKNIAEEKIISKML